MRRHLLVVLVVLAVVLVAVPAAAKDPRGGCGKGCPPPTTAPPPTTTTTGDVGGTGDGVVGYLGCTAAHDAAEGLARSGDHTLWGRYVPRDTPGPVDATLGTWAQPGFVGWDAFDAALAAHPQTRTVWVLVCYTDDDVRNGPVGPKAEAVIAVLRDRWAGPIVVSAPMLPGDAQPLCKTLDDPQTAAAWAWVRGSGYPVGPVLSTLDADEKGARCHATDRAAYPEWDPTGQDQDRGLAVWAGDLSAFGW